MPSLFLAGEALRAGRFDRCHFCDALTFCTINADRFGKATSALWPHHGDQANRGVLDANNAGDEPVALRTLRLHSNDSLGGSTASTLNCCGCRELLQAAWRCCNNYVDRLTLNAILRDGFGVSGWALRRNGRHLLQ